MHENFLEKTWQFSETSFLNYQTYRKSFASFVRRNAMVSTGPIPLNGPSPFTK